MLLRGASDHTVKAVAVPLRNWAHVLPHLATAHEQGLADFEAYGLQELAWIALSEKGYGIHGTPDPEAVSKRASHGCIRLTNWDALELAKHVSKGRRST